MKIPSRYMCSFAIVTALSLVGGVLGATAGESRATESGTRYLTTEELFKIYHNRSWIWSDGAGYFPNKERKFSAYSGAGEKASYAEGKWFLTWMGKACFRAVWHGAGYQTPKLTCFGHRTDGGVIFQRTEPDGEWYVFKNRTVMNGDEITKFLLGDYVSDGLNRNKTALGR